MGAVDVPEVVQTNPREADLRQSRAQHVLELPVLGVHLARVVREAELALIRLLAPVEPQDVDQYRRDRYLSVPPALRLPGVAAPNGDDASVEVDVGPREPADQPAHVTT
jgi:hypothetical protein